MSTSVTGGWRLALRLARPAVIIDINGYVAPDDGQRGLFYFPVTQFRASDSTTSTPYPDDTARNDLREPAATP
mgnify:CR=1 FL=1